MSNNGYSRYGRIRGYYRYRRDTYHKYSFLTRRPVAYDERERFQADMEVQERFLLGSDECDDYYWRWSSKIGGYSIREREILDYVLSITLDVGEDNTHLPAVEYEVERVSPIKYIVHDFDDGSRFEVFYIEELGDWYLEEILVTAA